MCLILSSHEDAVNHGLTQDLRHLTPTECLSECVGGGLAADISLGAVNGAAAVQYVRNMVQAAPPLKVLVLFIKALLKVQDTRQMSNCAMCQHWLHLCCCSRSARCRHLSLALGNVYAA